MTSVDSIIASLWTAVDHLHQAVTHVQGARDMAKELRDLFDQLGTYDLAERMQGIIDRTDDLLAMLLAGLDAGE